MEEHLAAEYTAACRCTRVHLAPVIGYEAVDVCVIGAGVIGASLAFHLARLGARVTVVDANREPRGASYATFGWINANGKQPDHYFELNRAGMSEHDELARLLGDSSWLRRTGSLELTGDVGGDALAARVAEHASRDYPAELISAAIVRQIEPELEATFRAANWDVAYFPSEGWVETETLIGRLLEAAKTAGASGRHGVRVQGVDARSAGVTVTLDSGSWIDTDVVVNCAGPDAGMLAAFAGLEVDTAGPVGLNAVTVPCRVSLRRVVRAPGVHFRPETGRRLMIATPSSDTGLAEGHDVAELAARNVKAVSGWVLIAEDTPVEEARVARRAVPPDGLPLVGRLDDSPWMYHVVTHSGVTLAPLLGRLVAEEIVNDTDAAVLAPYRPARFVGALA